MRQLPTFCLVVLFTSTQQFSSFGQESNAVNVLDQEVIDSLQLELRGEISDRARTEVFLRLAFIYADYNADSTNRYADKVLNASDQYQDLKLEARMVLNWSVMKLENNYEGAANTWEQLLVQSQQLEERILESEILDALAICYDFLGRYGEAESKYLESLEVAKAHGVSEAKLSSTYANFSDHYFDRGLFDMAEKYQLLALEIDKKSENKAFLAEDYSELGDIYLERSELRRALENYYRSQELYNEIEDERGQLLSWMNLGRLFEAQGEDSTALEYFDRVIKISEQSNYQLDLLDSYYSKAVLLTKQKRYQEAIEFFKKTLTIARNIDYEIVVAECLIGLAECKRLKGDQEEALTYARSGLQLSDKIGAASVYLLSTLELAKIYIGESDFGEAQKMLSITLVMADSLRELPKKFETISLLAELQYDLGLFESALENKILAHQLQDSLRKTEDVRTLRSLEMENTFKSEKDSIKQAIEINKLYRAASLNEQKATTRDVIILFIVAVILVILFYVSYATKKEAAFKLSLLNRDLQNQYDHLEKISRAKTRFFAIIAHDLRGPMGAFTGFYSLLESHIDKHYIRDNQFQQLTDKVQKSSDQILHLLDNLLKWALNEEGVMPHKPKSLPLLDCVKEAADVLESQIRSKDLALSLKVAEEVEVFADHNSLLTIIRNLIGNAIKFTPVGGSITITSMDSDPVVVLKVEDSGVGMAHEQLDNLFQADHKSSSDGTEGEQGTGLGLKLVRDFVVKNEGSIDVKSSPGEGTTFSITLPKWNKV